MPISSTPKNTGQPSMVVLPCLMAHSEDGKFAVIEVKISSDMPLPMPRSVISSPSHMISVVPAVSVRTMTAMPIQSTFGKITFWSRSSPGPAGRSGCSSSA